MYDYKKIEPLIKDPENEANKIKIVKILAEAKEAYKQIDDTMPNARKAAAEEKDELGSDAYYLVQFAPAEETNQANTLWAAASLMLDIPTLRTRDNINLSIVYLEKSGAHGWHDSFKRLGFLYSEGIPEIIPIDILKEVSFHEKSVLTKKGVDVNTNALAAAYEKLGLFYTAKRVFKITSDFYKSDAEIEVKTEAKKHIAICDEKLRMLHSRGFHAPDSPKSEETERMTNKRAKPSM